jgi:DNA mismatch repair protein MutL
MNDVIHLLPDSVANQIAAGEVVQRPASIVKEMVENSIDAGASTIQVLVVDGGKTCVQVIDDGKGMSETDARLSFERHATSKIQNASDLFSLTTMGFRGEALASIAAVSQVELKTRRTEDELGTCIRISGSKVDGQEPVACPVGCNFSVSNLFFNVPARRKFLKSNQTELTNIVSDFEKVALVYPNVNFLLYNNGVEVYNLPKSSVRQRIIDIFGKKINPELLAVDAETSLVRISGYVAKPETSRTKGARQYFFVNGRYMKHPYFHSAVMRAYENLIPPGEHVSYFIYLDVDPSSIDVNVHPTKTEIKFDNEQEIWQVLSAVVKEALGKFSDVPSIDFDVVDKPEIPVAGYGRCVPSQPKVEYSDYNPFKTKSTSDFRNGNVGWDELYDVIERKELSDEGGMRFSGDMQTTLPTGQIESFPDATMQLNIWHEDGNNVPLDRLSQGPMQFFQLKGRYIVLPVKSGLMLIDQRRAHIRVLYDRYMSALSNKRGVSQGVLFPEVVQFSKIEALAMDEICSDLQYVGFDFSNLGGGSYSILGVPAGIEGLDPVKLLHELVNSALEKNGNVRADAHEAIMLTLATSVAIVYGQVLQNDEIEQLIGDLFLTSSPMLSPDGKTIATIIEQSNIDKLF